MFHRALACVFAILVMPTMSAQAGNVTAIDYIGGPGGNGYGYLDPFYSNQADINMEFTSVAPIYVTVTVDGPGEYNLVIGPTSYYSTFLYNDTSVPWSTIYVGGPGQDFANQGSIFNSYLQGTDQGWLYGTTWNPGVYSGIVLGFGVTQAGTYTYTIIPNVPLGLSPVPEPASSLLLTIGLAAVVGYRKREASR